MITLICGTNRPNNITSKVVVAYSNLLKSRSIEHQILFLEDLPHDFAFNNDIMGKKNEDFSEMIRVNIEAADKFVFFSPEYNGGFPGVLKAFIDSIFPKLLKGKKVAMVGVASGRSGNLRGMDHLTNICNYLGMVVLPFKVPISSINQFLDEENNLYHADTLNVLRQQIEDFIKF